MRNVMLALVTALGVLVACVTTAQASTVCFATKQELQKAMPHQSIHYTTIKKTGNDHIDLVNAGPIGSKCWHTHYKQPTAKHFPRMSDALIVEYMYHFWPVPDYVPLK